MSRWPASRVVLIIAGVASCVTFLLIGASVAASVSASLRRSAELSDFFDTFDGGADVSRVGPPTHEWRGPPEPCVSHFPCAPPHDVVRARLWTSGPSSLGLDVGVYLYDLADGGSVLEGSST